MSDNLTPATFDTDNDGYVDQYGFDTNGDTLIDTWGFDVNQDTLLDGVAQDTNGDTVADSWGADLNQDGILENASFDTDADGWADTTVPATSTTGPVFDSTIIGGTGADWTIETPSVPGLDVAIVGGTGTGFYDRMFELAENAPNAAVQAQTLGLIDMMATSDAINAAVWLHDDVEIIYGDDDY